MVFRSMPMSVEGRTNPITIAKPQTYLHSTTTKKSSTTSKSRTTTSTWKIQSSVGYFDSNGTYHKNGFAFVLGTYRNTDFLASLTNINKNGAYYKELMLAKKYEQSKPTKSQVEAWIKKNRLGRLLI